MRAHIYMARRSMMAMFANMYSKLCSRTGGFLERHVGYCNAKETVQYILVARLSVSH